MTKELIGKELILRVYKIKKSGQKLVTIPKDCEIEAGDFVQIIKRELKGGVKEWLMKKI